MIRFKQECEVHINPLKSEYIIDSYKGTPSVLTGIEWVPFQLTGVERGTLAKPIISEGCPTNGAG